MVVTLHGPPGPGVASLDGGYT
ncbi:hypothetical protein pdam_00002578, partial [Pocillopora damicornis]